MHASQAHAQPAARGERRVWGRAWLRAGADRAGSSPASRARRLASILAIPLAWVALLATGCGGQGEVQAVEPQVTRARLVATRTLDARATDVRLTERVAALEPSEMRRLAFEVSGRLEMIVAEGTVVAADQPIARLGDTLERARVAKADASLRSARSERERLEGLARSRATSAKALEAAQVQEEIADAEMSMAREELSRRTLRAGIAGVIADTAAETGELVVPQREIATVVDTNELRWVIGLPGRQIGRIAPGAPVALRIPALDDLAVSGSVSWVAPAVLPGERLFEVQVSVPNPEARLRAGMSAWGAIIAEQLESAIEIPIDAVVERDGARVAFFVDRDHAAAVDVSAAVEADGALLLPADATAHRELVVRGQHGVGDGDAVRVNNAILEADGLLP